MGRLRALWAMVEPQGNNRCGTMHILRKTGFNPPWDVCTTQGNLPPEEFYSITRGKEKPGGPLLLLVVWKKHSPDNRKRKCNQIPRIGGRKGGRSLRGMSTSLANSLSGGGRWTWNTREPRTIRQREGGSRASGGGSCYRTMF